jgi:hypothetical protein
MVWVRCSQAPGLSSPEDAPGGLPLSRITLAGPAKAPACVQCRTAGSGTHSSQEPAR